MTYLHRRNDLPIEPELLIPRDLTAWRRRMRAGPGQPELTADRTVRAVIDKLKKREAPASRYLGVQHDSHVAARLVALADVPPPTYPSMTAILNAVSAHYGVTVLDIVSARRTAAVMRPRLVCYYLGRYTTLLSLPQVGKAIGGRDHTSCLSGIRKITRLRATSPDVERDLQEICATLGVTLDAD